MCTCIGLLDKVCTFWSSITSMLAAPPRYASIDAWQSRRHRRRRRRTCYWAERPIAIRARTLLPLRKTERGDRLTRLLLIGTVTPGGIALRFRLMHT